MNCVVLQNDVPYYLVERKLKHSPKFLHFKAESGTIYRVMQEEMTILLVVIISAVVRKMFIGIFV